MDKTKMKWIAKLARTKNFVVITDTEVVVSLKLSKDKTGDAIFVAQQLAALERIRDKISAIIGEYGKQAAEQLGGKPKRKSKSKKINVKQL